MALCKQNASVYIREMGHAEPSCPRWCSSRLGPPMRHWHAILTTLYYGPEDRTFSLLGHHFLCLPLLLYHWPTEPLSPVQRITHTLGLAYDNVQVALTLSEFCAERQPSPGVRE